MALATSISSFVCPSNFCAKPPKQSFICILPPSASSTIPKSCSLRICDRRPKSRIDACSNGKDLEEGRTFGGSSGSSSPKEASFDLKLPRRSLLVQFTCNACGERTQRTINRVAYERGTVFVQCAGCLVNHKLVDNLGLVVEYDLREEINGDIADSKKT